MLYLIVDPAFFFSPAANEDVHGKMARERAKDFIGRMVAWSEAARNYEIAVRISHECRKALMSRNRSSLDETWMLRLIQTYLPELPEKDMLNACKPFLWLIFDSPYIDVEMAILEEHSILWQLQMDRFVVMPEDYLIRIEDLALQECFKKMLAEITFARKNRALPISEFKNIYILTSFNEQVDTWAQDMEYQMVVHVEYDWVVDDSFDASVQDGRVVQDHYRAITWPHDVGDQLKPREPMRYSRVIEAVDAAIAQHPDILVLTASARRTAYKSNYENPNRIYELLLGLVRDWLPAFITGGSRAAWGAFYTKHQQSYANDESETIKRNERLRRDYVVTYDDHEYFCGKHVKLGVGPNCARINFEVVKLETGEYKLLIARAGLHGSNTIN